HAVVTPDALFRIAAFLMAEHDDGPPVDAREAADERVIVGELAIAVQLLEVREAALDVIERVRPVRMPRQLRDLPSRQVREDIASQRLALVLELIDLFADVDLRILAADQFQRFDFPFKLGYRLLEV